MPDDKATGVINYTTTGTKTSDKFIVAGTDTLTIGVTVNTGPAVYSIDVQLQTDGKWIPEIVDAAVTAAYKITARIKAYRLRIDTLDAGSIDFEAVAARRGL